MVTFEYRRLTMSTVRIPMPDNKVGMAWALSFWVGGPLEEVDGLLFDVPNWAQHKPLRGADELGA